MDRSTLRSLAVQLRHQLGRVGVRVDGVILFGSHASGKQRIDSDIDIAVLSRDFGKDRLAEGALVNIHASRLHQDLEAIPLSIGDWFDPNPTSPIINEIQKNHEFLI
jgi:predicted nucleotidyltransferase